MLTVAAPFPHRLACAHAGLTFSVADSAIPLRCPIMRHACCAVVLCASLLSACNSGHTRTALEQDTGPAPVLGEPHRTLIPTVDIAPAVGWPAQGKPVAAAGFAVNAFAETNDELK